MFFTPPTLQFELLESTLVSLKAEHVKKMESLEVELDALHGEVSLNP